jgi:hypothetical protein
MCGEKFYHIITKYCTNFSFFCYYVTACSSIRYVIVDSFPSSDWELLNNAWVGSLLIVWNFSVEALESHETPGAEQAVTQRRFDMGTA